MTPSQKRAVEFIHKHLENYVLWKRNPEYKDSITQFEVKDQKYFVSVAAQTEYLGLNEGNLLRAVEHKYFLFFIGKRGSITLKSAPDSYKQFDGKTAFGFNVDMS